MVVDQIWNHNIDMTMFKHWYGKYLEYMMDQACFSASNIEVFFLLSHLEHLQNLNND